MIDAILALLLAAAIAVVVFGLGFLLILLL